MMEGEAMRTLKQWREANARRIAAEYGCTLRDAAQCVDDADYYAETMRAIEDGEIVPASVYRTWTPAMRRDVSRTAWMLEHDSDMLRLALLDAS